jgi:hypothetical protein
MVHGGLMLIRYQRLKDCPDPDPLASVNSFLHQQTGLKDCPDPDPFASVNSFLHQQTGLRTALILIRLPV